MTICLFEKAVSVLVSAKRFAEFGDDASVTTVKITRRGRFSNCWAFPILECNYYTMDRIQKLLSRNHKDVKILCSFFLQTTETAKLLA